MEHNIKKLEEIKAINYWCISESEALESMIEKSNDIDIFYQEKKDSWMLASNFLRIIFYWDNNLNCYKIWKDNNGFPMPFRMLIINGYEYIGEF